MLTFIHLSDTHFGRPYFQVDTEVGARLQQEKQRAFRQLIHRSIEMKVQGILHAGDLFDGDRTDYQQVEFLRSQLERLGEFSIPFFIVTGNHDPKGIDFFEDLPHVYQFPMRESKKVELEDFSVTGISQIPQDNRNPLDFIEKNTDSKPAILLLHTHVRQTHDATNMYMPSSIYDLMDLGYDYVALGHVHRRMILEKSPLITYSGSFFPATRKEEGERGYFVVSLEKGFASASFAPSTEVNFASKTHSISSGSFQQEISALLEEYSPKTLLTLTLEGFLPYKSREKYLGALQYYQKNHPLFSLEIKDFTEFDEDKNLHPVCDYILEHYHQWNEDWLEEKRLPFLAESNADVLERFYKNKEKVIRSMNKAFRREDEY